MEESRLKIPDGYEVAYIEGSDIVLRSVLPKTWDDCYYGSRVQCSNLNIDDLRNLVPIDLVSPMLALCQLLVCRDVWWEKLGWKPDWADMVTKKYCLFNNKGKIDRFESFGTVCVLAFPAEDVREQFLEAFGDLIEEAKELI